MSVMLMSSMLAKAQFKAEITSDPEDGYYSGSQTYSPAEVATALGVDEATLQTLISNGGAVYIKTADGKSNSYTGNPNEFWMNASGVPQGYSDNGSCWYAGLYYNAAGTNEAGEATEASVSISVGQMPKYFSKIYEASDLKCTFILVSESKEATFDISLHVNAAAEPTCGPSTNKFSELEIVKSCNMTLPYTQGKKYENKIDSISAEGIADALGVAEADLIASLSDMIMTRSMSTDDSGSSTFSDDLVVAPFATDGWFGRYSSFDESTGEEAVYQQNGPKGWSAGCTFYLHEMKIADGYFFITHGQYDGTLVSGDKDYADIYIVNGTKAVKVTIGVDVEEAEVHPAEEMQIVGTASVDLESYIDANYVSKFVTFDIDDILSKLGCESVESIIQYQYAGETTFADVSNYDYWLNEQGYAESWGKTACAQLKPEALAEGKFRVLQMPDVYAEITEKVGPFPLKYALAYGANVYNLTVNYYVKPEEKKGDDFVYTKKGSDAIIKQFVPNSVKYDGAEKTELDLDYIEKLIGTKDFKIYSDALVTDSTTQETSLQWSSAYNCTPAPGFWFGSDTKENADKQNVVYITNWGSSCSFGFTYNAGVITWYEVEDSRSSGESFSSNIYLVNESTGDYVKYLLNISFVDEVESEAEVVYTHEENVAVSDFNYDKEGYIAITIPTDVICEKLGITAEQLSQTTLKYAKSANVNAATEYGTEVIFDVNGYYVSEEDESSMSHSAKMVLDGGLSLVIDAFNADFTKEDQEPLYVRFAIVNENKMANVIVKYEAPLATIGKGDLSDGYYGDQGAELTVNSGQTAEYEFVNYSKAEANYQNFVLYVRNAAENKDIVCLRADNWDNIAWGNTGCVNDYNWDTFTSDMNGAKVNLKATYSNGTFSAVFVITTAQGKVYNYSYTKEGIVGDYVKTGLTEEASCLIVSKAEVSGESDATAIASATAERNAASVKKVVRNGRITIEKGAARYSVSGARVK